MRRICTIDELRQLGVTEAARMSNWRRVEIGIYAEGHDPVTIMDRAIGALVATGGAASGLVAATLFDLDNPAPSWPDVTLRPTANGRRRRARRRELAADRIVVLYDDLHDRDVRCTSALQTLVDLAGDHDEDVVEQVLESVLRKRLTTIVAVEEAVNQMSRARTPGTKRLRRVLERRPPGAPATGSILETMTIQLIRDLTGLPEPQRQVEVYDRHGIFVAKVDLAWPEFGIFLELDGQGHRGQPKYDAARQTAVTRAMGWLVGRFTWDQVVRNRRSTARELEDLFEQGRRLTRNAG